MYKHHAVSEKYVSFSRYDWLTEYYFVRSQKNHSLENNIFGKLSNLTTITAFFNLEIKLINQISLNMWITQTISLETM